MLGKPGAVPRQEQAKAAFLAWQWEGPRESIPSPQLAQAGATQLCPEQMNDDGWEERGQEDEAASLLQGRHLQLAWPGVVWQEAWLGRRGGAEHGKGTESLPHANMVSCNHLNKSNVTTPSRSVSRVLKNRNMVSSRTRQHTKLSKSTARSGSE